MDELITTARSEDARQLIPRWDAPLIAASIAISLLGAFTSTQLMCQAKTSRYFTGVLVWTILGSLTFGFCSIWSLHEVAMLAYGLDLRIGINVGLTVLSAILAVFFTFIALASDMLYDRYRKNRRRKKSQSRRTRESQALEPSTQEDESSEPLLPSLEQANGYERVHTPDLERASGSYFSKSPQRPLMAVIQDASAKPASPNGGIHLSEHRPSDTPSTSLARTLRQSLLAEAPTEQLIQHNDAQIIENFQADSEDAVDTESYGGTLSPGASSRRSSSFGMSAASAMGLGGIMSMKRFRRDPDVSANPFVAIYEALIAGLTIRATAKGFVWAIAITSMHYVGIRGLEVPQGYVSLNPFLVLLSGIICWVVCVVGCILIGEIETHLGQQLLFSVVAACGVAAMHFTGMSAATFYSYAQPTRDRGYPPGLATATIAVAISTCIAANLLLAHSATVSRNKLAEIVWTRRKLWMAIAQKDSAESAAAARSEFIASASHEIRTPLHHLQGYSDLLSQTQLTEEGRLLLYAIQRATKTLSLITNNVLDWSRLEKDGEATCRPVSLDIRTTCESIVTLLPNQDEEVDVELFVVVSPDVPNALFIDETYIHRILMNLLSNALKFTSSGYILLLIEMKGDNLIASVTDTGCGVPPAFLPQLFEPFKQAQTRGRARGTGLGLSIIKQLLRKMNGNIEVESRFQDEEDVGPGRSGSTFTISMPVPHPDTPQDLLHSENRPKVALIHGGSDRALDGLTIAWEKFGFEVVVAETYLEELPSDLKYIWADLPSLKQHPHLVYQLFNRTECMVIIPYEAQSSLHEVRGLLQAPPHVVLTQKPLIWHTMKKRIAAAALQPSKSNPPRTVRFDPVVTDLEGPPETVETPGTIARQQSFAEEHAIIETVLKEPSPRKERVILLVEDNPINCKLGKKMLQSLGYQVIIAEDGVLAIEQILKHDAEVDAILMDQSMPRKDGLTATKEIRDMEKKGTLSRTRPIIAVSAVVGAEAQNLFRLAGANDFLPKPLSLGRLEQCLSMHLPIENGKT